MGLDRLKLSNGRGAKAAAHDPATEVAAGHLKGFDVDITTLIWMVCAIKCVASPVGLSRRPVASTTSRGSRHRAHS